MVDVGHRELSDVGQPEEPSDPLVTFIFESTRPAYDVFVSA